MREAERKTKVWRGTPEDAMAERKSDGLGPEECDILELQEETGDERYMSLAMNSVTKEAIDITGAVAILEETDQ